jgi:NAD(P)-dependent dehydrogenase (short-subunit alcohol dehydrogenase family)
VLSGKTILITGAAGGLGSALTFGCLKENASVILLDKNERELEKIHATAVDKGWNKISLVPLDLARAGPEEFRNVVTEIDRQFGGLDTLVHCAVQFDSLGLLEQIEPDQWLENLQVNLNAPWLLSTVCLPLLRRSRSGCLVFMLDDLEEAGKAFRGAYGASKHALNAIAGMFSQECRDIRVLGINPGPMRSAFRQNTHYAERPADQPDPEEKAKTIIGIMSETMPGSDLYIDLSAETFSKADG